MSTHPLEKCRTCGSIHFFLHESLVWKADLDEDGTLSCWNRDNGIDAIACDTCGEEYAEADFAAIEFN